MKRLRDLLTAAAAKWWSALKQAVHTRALYLAVFWFAGGLYFVLLLSFSMFPAHPLIEVGAVTEGLRIDDVVGETSPILLVNAWVVEGEEQEGHCENGLFTPSTGTDLSLQRFNSGPLVIKIVEGGGVLQRGDWRHGLKAGDQILFDPERRDCKAPDVVRVPIEGAVTLGSDYSAEVDSNDPAPLLRSGHLNTYSRAFNRLGWAPFQLTFGASALFPTGTINLPSGARLKECPAGQDPTVWSGFAEARLKGQDPEDRAITFSAFTQAARLSLTTPGGAKSGGAVCGPGDAGNARETDLSRREDVIEVSLLSRLVGDPNFSTATLLTAGVLFLLQTLVAIHNPEKPSRKTPRKGRKP